MTPTERSEHLVAARKRVLDQLTDSILELAERQARMSADALYADLSRRGLDPEHPGPARQAVDLLWSSILAKEAKRIPELLVRQAARREGLPV